MRLLWMGILAGVIVVGAGCVSKSRARAEAQAAFEAGQRQALPPPQAPPGVLPQAPLGTTVTVRGEVRQHVILWTEDLTLAKAIVLADYYGLGNPRAILITRQGIQYTIDPQHLLAGTEDPPLAPGDVVDILR